MTENRSFLAERLRQRLGEPADAESDEGDAEVSWFASALRRREPHHRNPFFPDNEPPPDAA